MLIGDPKQAIYAFRGADVYAYLGAAPRPAPRDASDELASDQASRRPRRAVRGARLGHEGIVYRRPGGRGTPRPRLHERAGHAPLRVRILQRSDPV